MDDDAREKPPSKLPTVVALDPELRKKLDALARKKNVSRSWLTADAVREYLKRHEPQGEV